MDYIKTFSNKLPILRKIEELTDNKIKRDKILLAFLCVSCVLTMNSSLRPLTNFVIMISPLLETISLYQQPLSNPENLKKKNLFWMLFGLFTVMDPIISKLFVFIPFYYTFRFLFFFLLSIEEENLCNFLIEKVLKEIPVKSLLNLKVKTAVKEATKMARETLNQIKEGKMSTDMFGPKDEPTENKEETTKPKDD